MTTISELNPARAGHWSADEGTPPTVLAIEAVLLWPRRPTRKRIHDGTDGLWPVLAVVLGDRAVADDPSVRDLFTLLYRVQWTGRLTVLHGTSRWSIRDGHDPLLRLAVRANAPVKLDVDVVLPVRPLRDVLPTLARGATVAITTRRHADRLAAGVSVRDALHGLVLVNCPPSLELAAMARDNHRAGERQRVR